MHTLPKRHYRSPDARMHLRNDKQDDEGYFARPANPCVRTGIL